MNGWTRVWMVISLLATGAVLAFGVFAFYADAPERVVYIEEIAQQLDRADCQSLRPAVQRLQDEAAMWRLLSAKPECSGYISFGYQHKYSWDWIKTSEDYRHDVRVREESRNSHFGKAWFLAIPVCVTFVGFWIVFFTVRSVFRWIARGFSGQRGDHEASLNQRTAG